jgi:hypothetical protein
MNGNVSREGILADLEWMDRIGVGGVNIIQASFATPSATKSGVSYMSSEWKDAVRYAVEISDKLGLEVSIASSPGWSGTGGPEVSAAQSMKKLVWSETILDGGKLYRGKLSTPPSVSGPFQDVSYVARNEAWVDIHPPPKPPAFYADAAVTAYRMRQAESAAAPAVSSSDGVIDAARLAHGNLSEVDLRAAPNDA